MDSAVLKPDVAAALDDVEAALGRLGDLGVVPAGHRDAVLLIWRVECVGRRVDSLRNELFTAIDDDMLYAADGHFSAKVMVRHAGRLSPGEAAGRAAAALALAELPELKAAYERGEVGTCQIRRIGRAFANKRVREQLVADEKRFIDLAKNKSYKAFDDRVTDWVRLVDQDGTADTTQAQHDNRDFGLWQEYDLGWNLKGLCGSLQGAQVEEIWRKFLDAEFRADWDKARNEHGPDATITKDMLARTDAQRRWDAFLEMTLRAVTGDGQGNRPGFTTNIIIDQRTFETELAKIFGGTPEAPDPWDPDFACRTLNGNPIQTTEAMAAAMVDKVRRLVIDAAGVTIDMGRGSRLFSGNGRLAVQATQTHCRWVGCYTRGTDCQIDHTVPWAEQQDGTGGGCTCPANGAVLCGRHNRLKEQGYSVRRDEHGQWHTHKPDGTEIDP